MKARFRLRDVGHTFCIVKDATLTAAPAAGTVIDLADTYELCVKNCREAGGGAVVDFEDFEFENKSDRAAFLECATMAGWVQET